MKHLNKLYEQNLETIAEAIQASDILASYLEEEEEAFYKELVETFEPEIEELYTQIALTEPLQIYQLEDKLLDERFEGLFLPRILGYNVLRGALNDRCKYTHAQDRFGRVLSTICDSSNFDYIRKRIGQSVQIGFALSSDIWITSFIDQVSNKKVKQFLQAQKLEKYQYQQERVSGYKVYASQFEKFNSHTTEFPTDLVSQQLLAPGIFNFLKARAVINEFNENFIPEVLAYLEQEKFHHTKEHTVALGLVVNYFDLKKADQTKMGKILNKLRDADDFNEIYFNFLLERFKSKLKLTGVNDKRVAALMDLSKAEDDFSRYYAFATNLSAKGYMHDEVIEHVKTLYGQYEGMSLFNECVRNLVLGYFSRFLSNLDVDAYADYFELNKYMVIYMEVFSNEHFNQDIKDLSMAYVAKLMKAFTDKRGKDYQDIKKFVATNFVEMQFMRDKDIVEMFKSKRKKAH
jgi:hypothetical protein